ncbi:MAG TPA: hypothetical protein VFS44_14040 [Gemmatimonadaceae bacterium]|nr:hypothetical protein [Gemmatimonadaceae bacterium]
MRARHVLLALFLLASPAAAQGVLVAPPGLFIDHGARGGSLELYNPGADPAEVEISLEFGYPVSDSTGRVTLLMANADTARASAARWIEAFPRRLTLAPRQRQTVRLLAKPPAGLPDGEYWARIVVAAKGARVRLDSAQDDGGIEVGLTLNVRTVVALLYRQGKVATGLDVRDTRAWVDHDSLLVRARFERHGNAAFIGRARGSLTDASGKTVASFTAPLAVYYTLEPRFAAPVRGLAPGRYVLHLDVDTERDDVRRESLLPIDALRDSTSVLVSAR